MSDNYEKEIQEFSNRFESGDIKVEYLTNDGIDYTTKEDRDTAVFLDHLKAKSSIEFVNKVFGNGSGKRY